MMSDPFGRHYGYGLMRQAQVLSGTLYPRLDQMLQDGWVTDAWELPDEAATGKPRRYYTLTDLGRRELGALAEEAHSDPRFQYLFGATA